jgi:ribulose-phosphate 3-epimerase
MYKVAPSLLATDFKCLQEQLEIIEKGGAEYIHLDIMDGRFVPNLSFGMTMIKSIRSASNLVFDVHMMVEEPIRFIDGFKNAGADIISVHYEACNDIKATIAYIKKIGIKAGVVLNPETPVEVLSNEIIESVDVIQLMTVQPGLDGQKFIPESLNKIKKVKQRINDLKLEKDIEADGDITLDNIQAVLRAGANIIVSGKGLFNGDIKENISRFKKEIDIIQSEG